MQLAIKQADFARQQLTRGVIDTSPLKNMVYEHKGSKQYIIEQPRVAADGTPISSGRIIKAEDYSQAAKGIARLDENGKVVYQACFAAGTLVHTDQGPLPIEKVRVGTKVLSQPENGGKIAYKRVINTVAHLDQQVHAVQVKVEGSDELTTLITTPNHPFWVQERLVHDQHWLAAEHLAPGMVLQIAGGGAGDNSAPRQATVYANGLIRHTQHAHIGFAADDRVGVGMVLDLTDPKQVHLVKPEQASELGSLQLGKPFLTPVYNFEVEDFHTYYVGDAAVWVHNTNCAPGAPVDFVLRKVDREAPRPQCFPVDTYVVTRDRQWIEIDRLDVGHWVLSRCEKTGQQDYRRVVKKFEHQRESIFAPETPLYRIIIVTAEGRKDALQATAEHPFWVNGVGWVKACELQPGQMLEICDPIGEDDCNRPEGQKAADLTLSGQRWQAEIESVCQDSESGLVYNIEVEDFHTYFVGCHGVWVHNKDSHDGVPVFSQPLKLSNPDAKAFAGKFNQNRRVEKAGDTIENNNAARAENEFADALAQHDNLEVVQLSNKNGLGKNGSSNPDVLVNARITDFYTPQKPPLDKPQLTDPVVLQKKLVTIYDTIKLKSKEQSSDVALNLRYLDGAVTEAQILEMMAAKPIPTLGRLSQPTEILHRIDRNEALMRSTHAVAAHSRATKIGDCSGQAAGHTPERRGQVGTGAGVQEITG
ncbi:MAG: polymorphic toxin-type HINT domain-containing protein, partial [Hydrogenophaga sp.]|uniref:polymorphic toxin-type HINT domain-containing protein n=2 Tax=Hydrogenophaga sp. TaxID=1904254 RepID=UPI002728B51B